MGLITHIGCKSIKADQLIIAKLKGDDVDHPSLLPTLINPIVAG